MIQDNFKISLATHSLSDFWANFSLVYSQIDGMELSKKNSFQN